MVRKYNAFNPCVNAEKVLEKYSKKWVMKLPSLEVIDDKFDDLTDSVVKKLSNNKAQSFTDWVLDFQQDHQELLSEDNYDDVMIEKAEQEK